MKCQCQVIIFVQDFNFKSKTCFIINLAEDILYVLHTTISLVLQWDGQKKHY